MNKITDVFVLKLYDTRLGLRYKNTVVANRSIPLNMNYYDKLCIFFSFQELKQNVTLNICLLVQTN